MKLCWAECAAQKARREAEEEIKEKAERQRVVEEEERKRRTVKYLQWLWDEVIMEGAERSQVVESKCRKILPENNADCQPSKKAKRKQPARYQGDMGIKLGKANPCERYVCAGQDCLVYNSR